MTQHLHSSHEPDCWRCQLSRDESEQLRRQPPSRTAGFIEDWLREEETQ